MNVSKLNSINNRKLYSGILAGWLLFGTLYSILLFHLFPFRELLNEFPFFREDYPLHFYNAATVADLILEKGKTWGYDPFRMAGYPLGTLFSVDNKATEIFVALFHFLGKASAFNIFVVITYLSFPFLLWSAARNFGYSREEALLSLYLLLSLLFLDKIAIAFIAFGGFCFLLSCLLMLYLTSLWYRLLNKGAEIRCLIILFIGSTFFWVHISAVTIFFVMACFTGWVMRTHLNRRNLSIFSFWLFTTLLVNTPWILLVIRFWPMKTLSQAYAYYSPTGWHGLWEDLIDPIMWVRKPLLLAAIYGVLGHSTARSRILWFSAAFFLFLAYFGNILPFVDHLEPYRYVLPAFFCLCAPAASGLCNIIRFLSRRRYVQGLFFASLLLIVSLPTFLSSSISGVYSLWAIQLNSRYDPRGIQLMAYLEKHTTREGRILMEDAGYKAGGLQYYDSHLPGVIPYLIKREVIGGPEPSVPLIHHFADFTNGRLFTRPIEEYDEKLFLEYMDTYNIRWIVAWSEPSKRVLEGFCPNLLDPLTTVDKFSIFVVKHPTSYFYKGTGKLIVELDRIEIWNASAGEIVLKYHYMDTLKTEPAIPIERAEILDDPVGFIRIFNEPHHSRILIQSGSLWR